MAEEKRISFSKEYVMEIAVAELRRRHNIPEDFVTVISEYGSNYLSFEPVVVEEEKTEE